MVEWNNARVLEESKRRDRLVDHIVDVGDKEVKLNFALNIALAAFSFVAFVVTREVVSFSFMAVPAVSIAFNIYKESKGDKDSGKDE